MALHVQSEDDDFRIPAAGLQVIRRNVAHFSRPTAKRAAFLESAGKPGFQVLTPHKIYVAGLEDCPVHKDMLSTARRIGWRYLLFQRKEGEEGEGIEVVAAVELEAKTGSDEARFIRVVQGPAVKATFEILSSIGDRVKDSEFELRVLQVLDLNFSGLWFHCYDDREKDFVMPLPPVPDELKEKTSYSRAEFLPLMEEIAKKVKAAFLEAP